MPVKGGLVKIVVLGAGAVGKTSIIEQIVYGNYDPDREMQPTIEDTYDAWIEGDRAVKEHIRIYDTKGLILDNISVPPQYYHIADAFVLVFSITSKKSFHVVEYLKKEIDRHRGKDVPVVVLGSKVDMTENRECDHAAVIKWADAEKVKLFEVLVMNRNTLQEPMTYLVKKINAASGKPNTEMKKIFRRSGKSSKDSQSSDI